MTHRQGETAVSELELTMSGLLAQDTTVIVNNYYYNVLACMKMMI